MLSVRKLQELEAELADEGFPDKPGFLKRVYRIGKRIIAPVAIPAVFLAAMAQDALAGPTLREIQDNKTFSGKLEPGPVRHFQDSGKNKYVTVGVEDQSINPDPKDSLSKQQKDMAKRRMYLVFHYRGTMDPRELELVDDWSVYREVVLSARLLKEMEQGLGENISRELDVYKGLEDAKTAEYVLEAAKKAETYLTSLLLGVAHGNPETTISAIARDEAAKFFFREIQRNLFQSFNDFMEQNQDPENALKNIDTNTEFKKAMYKAFENSMRNLQEVNRLASNEFSVRQEGILFPLYRTETASRMSSLIVRGYPIFRSVPNALREFYLDEWSTNLLLSAWAEPIASGVMLEASMLPKAARAYVPYGLDEIVDGHSRVLAKFRKQMNDEGKACLLRYGFEGAVLSTENIRKKLLREGLIGKQEGILYPEIGVAQKTRTYRFFFPTGVQDNEIVREEGQISMHVSGPRAVVPGDKVTYRVILTSPNYPFAYTSAMAGGEKGTVKFPDERQIKTFISGIENTVSLEDHNKKLGNIEEQLKASSLFLKLVDSAYSGLEVAVRPAKEILEWGLHTQAQEIQAALPEFTSAQNTASFGTTLFREPNSRKYRTVVFEIPMEFTEPGIQDLQIASVSDSYSGDTTNSSLSVSFSVKVGQPRTPNPSDVTRFYHSAVLGGSEKMHRSLFYRNAESFKRALSRYAEDSSWSASAPEVRGDDAAIIVTRTLGDKESKELWELRKRGEDWRILSISEYGGPKSKEPGTEGIPDQEKSDPIKALEERFYALPRTESKRLGFLGPLLWHLDSTCFSPDGRYLAYLYTDPKKPQEASALRIRVARLDPKFEVVYTSPSRASIGTWASTNSGNRLSVSLNCDENSIYPKGSIGLVGDVFTLDFSNTLRSKRVTSTPSQENQSAYIGRDTIAYVVGRTIGRPRELVILSEERERRIPFPENISCLQSLDGRRLVYIDLSGDITFLDTKTLKRERLGTDEIELTLAVSRAGQIVYTAFDGVNSDIYTLDPGSRPVNITNTPDINESSPSWLDRRIVYEAQPLGSQYKFIVISDAQGRLRNLVIGDTEQKREISRGGGLPICSPSGNRLVYRTPYGSRILQLE